MNKSILWLIGVLVAVSFAIVSCSESDGAEDPYANWDERNQQYIDSIATVARANAGSEPGQWKVIRSYKLPAAGLNESTVDVNDYVYCKIIKKGDGTVSPIFTDTVSVNYRGKLMNGVVFDQSYQGTLDPATAIPVKFVVGKVVTGWTTALMEGFGNMKVGDRWELYIPYKLAYGESGQGTIPGYSTLIFDLDLADIYPMVSNGRSVEALAEE